MIKFFSILLFVSDVNQTYEEKYNRTPSDLMDEINQNRHGGGRRGVKGYLVVFFTYVFLFVYLFILFIFIYLILLSVGIIVI